MEKENSVLYLSFYCNWGKPKKIKKDKVEKCV